MGSGGAKMQLHAAYCSGPLHWKVMATQQAMLRCRWSLIGLYHMYASTMLLLFLSWSWTIETRTHQTVTEDKESKRHSASNQEVCLGRLHMPYVVGRASSHSIRTTARVWSVLGTPRQSICCNLVRPSFLGAYLGMFPILNCNCRRPAPRKCSFPWPGAIWAIIDNGPKSPAWHHKRTMGWLSPGPFSLIRIKYSKTHR